MQAETKSIATPTEEALRAASQLIAELVGVPVAGVASDHRLIDDLAMDSLEVIELAMALEERWGVTIDESQLKQLRRVSDVALLLT
ncbi:hypothetical protein WJ60_06290 [Burkholderia ubonensis]|uniref:phosphopantetheine-binding protein n=1 Tax=Burkholderia ubonensis TaxID=101571 RepID=UPI000751CF82|nr:phosphopantetheine-binding protein [Burkholderia ubonensis]KVM73920.1 hypothetical protein WJ60_06290 [Burkholderia ubonensis]